MHNTLSFMPFSYYFFTIYFNISFCSILYLKVFMYSFFYVCLIQHFPQQYFLV